MRKYTIVRFNTHPDKGVEFFKRLKEVQEIGLYDKKYHAEYNCSKLREADPDHLYLIRELDFVLMDGLPKEKTIVNYHPF